MLYYVVTIALAVCDVFLGAGCKALIFYAAAFMLIACGSVIAYAQETKSRNIFYILGAIAYSVMGAYAMEQHSICEIYCADFELIAAQMFTMALYSLLSVKMTRREELQG